MEVALHVVRLQPLAAMVLACSGLSRRRNAPTTAALLLAIVLIAEQMLSRMPSRSSATWLVTLCGGSAA